MIGEGFDLPTGRRLEEQAMSIRTLPRATPKALERARKTWPEARAEDFEVEASGSATGQQAAPIAVWAAIPASAA